MELTIPPLSIEFASSGASTGFSLDMPQIFLKKKELTFLMGHNGSGKSLFLKLLTGELSPSNSAGQNDHTYIDAGFVRQQAELNLASDLTVRDNLLLRLRAANFYEQVFPAKRLNGQIVSLLGDHPELARKLDQPCRNLSVGQRQTLAFLAVTCQRFPLLLLDEFLAATDHNTSNRLRAMTRLYAERTPAGVIIVSHDIHLALQEANRILILRQGALRADIRPEDPDWNENFFVKNLAL